MKSKERIKEKIQEIEDEIIEQEEKIKSDIYKVLNHDKIKEDIYSLVQRQNILKWVIDYEN